MYSIQVPFQTLFRGAKQIWDCEELSPGTFSFENRLVDFQEEQVIDTSCTINGSFSRWAGVVYGTMDTFLFVGQKISEPNGETVEDIYLLAE